MKKIILLLSLLISTGSWSDSESPCEDIDIENYRFYKQCLERNKKSKLPKPEYSEGGFFYKDIKCASFGEGRNCLGYRDDKEINKLKDYFAPQILIENVITLQCPNVSLERKFGNWPRENQGDLYLQILLGDFSSNLRKECGIGRIFPKWAKGRAVEVNKEEAIKIYKEGGEKELSCEFDAYKPYLTHKYPAIHQFLINKENSHKYEELDTTLQTETAFGFCEKLNANEAKSVCEVKGVEAKNFLVWDENYIGTRTIGGHRYQLNRENLELIILPDSESVPYMTTDPFTGKRVQKTRMVYKMDKTKAYQCERVVWKDALKTRELYLVARQALFEELERNRKRELENKESKRKF